MRQYTPIQKVIGAIAVAIVFGGWAWGGIDAFHRGQYMGTFATVCLIGIYSYHAYKVHN